jgi:membrane protein implicated in regulation of membrane protease activity
MQILFYFQVQIVYLLPLVTFYINFGLILVIFVVSVFADLDAIRPFARGQQQQQQRKEQEESTLLENTNKIVQLGLGQNPCPELYASFISRCFYGWFFK